MPQYRSRRGSHPAQDALEAAAAQAQAAGITPSILSDRIEGEARDIGALRAAMVQQVIAHGQPFSTPCVLRSGGETTVTVRGNDRGGRAGRNVEFLLSLAHALVGAPRVHAQACDTDGIDGSENSAGAFPAPESLARAKALDLSARKHRDNNDGYGFCSVLNDLVIPARRAPT